MPLSDATFVFRCTAIQSKIPPAIEEAARLVADGFKVPIAATYRLSEIKRAVEHTLRGGKVLLDVAGA